jgi:hypothetical protein
LRASRQLVSKKDHEWIAANPTLHPLQEPGLCGPAHGWPVGRLQHPVAQAACRGSDDIVEGKDMVGERMHVARKEGRRAAGAKGDDQHGGPGLSLDDDRPAMDA